MNRKRSQDGPEWTLASFRVAADEFRHWKKVARQVDLSLSQAMRRGMRQFIRETEQQLGATSTEGDA
jgi:hypothetical protein